MKTRWLPLMVGSAFLLGALGSCSGAEEGGITPLTYGMEYDASLDEEGTYPSFESHAEKISHPKLASKIERGESFLLLIRDGASDCACWDAYESVLTSFQKERDALVYWMEPDDFSGRDTYGLKIVDGDDTFAIFNRGSLKEQRLASDGDWLSNYDEFDAYISEKVSFPSMRKISLSKLDDVLSEGATGVLVYFGREGCSDCSYIESHFLFDYLKEDRIASYRVECDAVGIRYADEETYEEGVIDEDLWQSFKDSYGLSDSINDGLGYGDGYVPSFVYYNAGEATDKADLALDMCVPYNDVLEEKGDGYVIADSFYDEARLSVSPYFQTDVGSYSLVDLEIPSEDVLNGTWKKEAAASYHEGRLQGFLDNYLTR